MDARRFRQSNLHYNELAMDDNFEEVILNCGGVQYINV